jgi:hypothetical protein
MEIRLLVEVKGGLVPEPGIDHVGAGFFLVPDDIVNQQVFFFAVGNF